MPAGYYRFPTLHADTVVFACEDDLWTAPAAGGLARRLTANLGEASRPSLSPDGAHLAFVGREDGQPEIYLMPAQGGPAHRLTYLGGSLCQTAGWTPAGRLVFANNAGQPFTSLLHLYTLDLDGGQPARLEVGPARAVAFGPDGARVIGRNTGDPARWKRYRGGTAGQLWIDRAGDGQFAPLLNLAGNLTAPLWVGERLYFLSDHEGVGNLYSCTPAGQDLRRHTDHADFYARHAASDGRRIVYHAGADLYLYDPASDRSVPIPVEFHSPQVQRGRRFVDAARYLDHAELHPKGQALAITTRGQAFTFFNWEGAVRGHGDPEAGARYRLLSWLNDGQRLVAVTDAGGEEAFVLLSADGRAEPERLPDLDIGRPVALAVNPQKDELVFSNHRQELLHLDLTTRALRRIDRGVAERIAGFAWSPDGAWVAYSVSISLQVSVIKLWQAETGLSHPVTRPVLRDTQPAFDPDGQYLYFLSYRDFNPVPDNLHFDLNFPRGMRPFLVTLQAETPSPFIPRPKDEDKEKEKDKDPAAPGQSTPPAEAEAGAEASEPEAKPAAEPEPKKKPAPKPVRVDLAGLPDRVLAFPVDEGRYGRVLGLKGGKVLYSRYPVEGALEQDFFSQEPAAKGLLYLYTLDEQKEELLVSGLSGFSLSREAGALLYRAGNSLRVLRAGEKPSEGAGRKGGWINLERVKVAVTPGVEWRQMFREAWRLQRDQFWTPDMSQVDWLAVHDRYLALVDRVASRAEFSDLLWEMQGELGTSHCYELGGDYRPQPNYAQGSLGADFTYDPATDSWRLERWATGDSWDARAASPLAAPGVAVQAGDRLLAVNGRRLSRARPPAAALLNLAGQEVILTVAGPEPEAAPRSVTVKTLANELPLRYRAWVEANRQRVHAATAGRVGYLHIPDMGARGYAEFHRGYLAEVDRDGLIVDVRFNGGGNVSGLLLEKLARRRLGYSASRWSEALEPYPAESVLGPIVALTNEQAGSDGDIFSHGFKLLKLGRLIGKRTWGGVVGIWPRHALVDGTVTTQPEFSFWFEDVGWGVENYGTDPDLEMEITPQDHARGVDTQLERAIAEALAALEAAPPRRPALDNRPSRAAPRLPAR